MAKFFMLVTNEASAAQQVLLRGLFRHSGFGWWHHFPQAWMLTTLKEEADVTMLREAIMAMTPGLQFFVFEMQPARWAGYAPNRSGQWLDAVFFKRSDS